MATRWGIVSVGKISHDFTLALSTLPCEEHTVVAVAARDTTRAAQFAATHNIPKSYGDYKELARDANVDVIYIGSINPEHLSLSKLYLEAGKAVLCEKPLCMNKKESSELISLARSKRLFLMEAIWSRFNPVYVKIKEEIEAGTIGEVLQIQVNFGVKLDKKDRVVKKELGGSVILDIGVYTIQLATWLMGKPERVQATGHLNSNGVDDSMSAMLSYPDGKVAVLQAHSRVVYDNHATIHGTKGNILISSPFWCPTEAKILDKTFSIQLPEKSGFYHTNSAALSFEAREVRRCLQEGLLQSPAMTWQDSLDIAEIEDEIRRQIGVTFDCD